MEDGSINELLTSDAELEVIEDADADALIVATEDGSINVLLTESELDATTEEALLTTYAELEAIDDDADVEALKVATEDGSIKVLLIKSELDAATDDALVTTEAELELSVGRATYAELLLEL
jgi:hypothetical protein